MATILPTYDWTRASAHIENARSRAYPWEEWLDGQIRKLDRHEDFDGPSMSVERVIRTSANRRGIRVRIRVEGESMVIGADTFVLCAGQESVRDLYDELVALGRTVAVIGGADVAAELDAKRAIEQGVRLAAAG